MDQGFEYVATGHYAKICLDSTNKKALAIPKDQHKTKHISCIY
jgi:tRNA U34 2-thiouridine synthase MnmA/TrmU